MLKIDWEQAKNKALEVVAKTADVASAQLKKGGSIAAEKAVQGSIAVTKKQLEALEKAQEKMSSDAK